MSGIAQFLRDRHVNVSWRSGWQSINCPSPEHEDKNASASVHIDRGKVHCHGCGIFEDIIGLLRLEGLSYAEAKREAAEKYGESFPDVSGKPNRAVKSRDRLFNDAGNNRTDSGTVPTRSRRLGLS